MALLHTSRHIRSAGSVRGPAWVPHAPVKAHSIYRRGCTIKTAAAGAASPVQEEVDNSWEGAEPCYPAMVYHDNSTTRYYTEIAVEVKDYPGLLRVIAWVMNGLSVRVHNAALKTLEDGTARDVFWVTDREGRKLSDARAVDVVDRLEQFLSFCAPPAQAGEFTEYKCGDIEISNIVHPSCTQVTVTADLFSPGLLLELASIIHGQGYSVAEAVIRGGPESPITQQHCDHAADLPQPPSNKRVIRFWLKGIHTGAKLEYDDVSALVYTLRLAMGGDNTPLKPPNSDINAIVCECPEDLLP